MNTPNMLNRATLQPHLVNLIARLGRADVELAVGLLLDYIDAGRPATRRSTDELQVVQVVQAQITDDRLRELIGGELGSDDEAFISYGRKVAAEVAAMQPATAHLLAEARAILEHAETSAETREMAHRHHVLVDAIRRGQFSIDAHPLVVQLRARIADLKRECVRQFNEGAESARSADPFEPTDAQIDAIAAAMPGGVDGFLKGWGWRQFAREVLALRAPPAWVPQFDVMVPKQEELAIQFCTEIVGRRGEGFRGVDPVRLLEMAQELYEAEREGVCDR